MDKSMEQLYNTYCRNIQTEKESQLEGEITLLTCDIAKNADEKINNDLGLLISKFNELIVLKDRNNFDEYFRAGCRFMTKIINND